MYNISKTVLKKQESEDPQYNALKLVEVIIVNHRYVSLKMKLSLLTTGKLASK